MRQRRNSSGWRCAISLPGGRAAKDGKAAMNPFAILYAGRFVRPSVAFSTRLEHGISETPRRR